MVYMNWIDIQVVAIGSCRINHFLFADDLVLLESSDQGFQHALAQFSAVYNQVVIKISIEKTEISCVFRNPMQCMLQVSSNRLQQVKFKYFGVVFTSDGKWNEEIDT